MWEKKSQLTVLLYFLFFYCQGPILGCAFGYSIRDRTLFINGFLNEIFALVRPVIPP